VRGADGTIQEFTPGAAAPYVAACHFYFNAIADFRPERTV
jgi:hypothetical protein